MKKFTKFLFFSAATLSMGMMASCSNDDFTPLGGSNDVLVKAPKITAYSGDTYFGDEDYTTRSVDIDVTPAYIAYGSKEQNDVKDFFSKLDSGEDVNGEILTIDEAFDGWTDYWVQTVAFNNGEDDYNVIRNIGIWNEIGSNWEIQKWTEKDNYYFDGGEPGNNGHMKQYVGKDGVWQFDRVKFENWPIADFSYTTYLKNAMAQQYRGKYSYVFGTKPGLIRSADAKNYPAYRIARIDGYDEVYVAFYAQNLDYYHYYAPGGGASGGVQTQLDLGDNQWNVILKLTRVQELCHAEGCGHPVHTELGYCPICVELGITDTSCTENAPAPETPETPETPEAGTSHNHNNEVEVNLHGVERNGGYLESHLSIHVRYAGDVEVFIPVPIQYTCDADDMDIVMKHEANHMSHTKEWTLKDSETSQYGPLKVSVTVTYEDGGIRITTHGITEDVIAWCGEKFDGDGITFEIWNYYNDPDKVAELPNGGISLEELQYLLNQATVKFLGANLPDAYINAFAEDNGTRNSNDCKVTIVEEQREYYGNPEVGEHLNGSTKNVIYERE